MTTEYRSALRPQALGSKPGGGGIARNLGPKVATLASAGAGGTSRLARRMGRPLRRCAGVLAALGAVLGAELLVGSCLGRAAHAEQVRGGSLAVELGAAETEPADEEAVPGGGGDALLPQEDGAAGPSRSELGTFIFQLENDLFSGSDRHYTNGIRLSWTSPDEPKGFVRRNLGKAVGAVARHDDVDDERKHTRYGLSLGQNMFTPEDRERSDLIVEDRPYAGWLYGAVSMHTVTEKGGRRSDLESVELQLGVVGPWALGKQGQDLVHEIRLMDKFEGWSNQLDNEPGLLLLYERKWRLGDALDLGFVQVDAIPHAGAGLGNVLTQVNLGGAARMGWRLPEDFGPPSLIRAMMPLDGLNERDWSFYLFASVDGRYVAHNIFLDGNTFRDSHSVDREDWVGDIALGATLALGRVKIAYSSAVRSREFEGQSQDSRFGSLSISMQTFLDAD